MARNSFTEGMPGDSPPRARDLVLTDGATLRVSEHRQVHVDPGMTEERGDGQPSLTIVRQGAHLHRTGGEAAVVDAGSAVLYQGNAPFQLEHPFLHTSPDISLYIEFDRALLDEVFGGVPPARALGRPLSPAAQAAAALLVARAADGDALAGEERALRLLGAVSHELAPGPDARAPTAEARRRIAMVREAIAAAPERRHDLAELATIAGCSPFHLTRLFRRVTGLTLGQFRLRLRLARALQLLADSGEDLTAIAHAAGFFDHAHMTNSMGRAFGATPTALREALAGRRLADAGKTLQAETLAPG